MSVCDKQEMKGNVGVEGATTGRKASNKARMHSEHFTYDLLNVRSECLINLELCILLPCVCETSS